MDHSLMKHGGRVTCLDTPEQAAEQMDRGRRHDLGQKNPKITSL
jgi:hypothetical protein